MNLKRLLRKNKPAYPVISGMLQAFEHPLAILAEDGTILFGSDESLRNARMPVTVAEVIVGWVAGPRPQAAAVAALLEEMLVQETEERALSDELLDKYRELNVLYSLSEHLLATPDPEAIAKTTLREISLIIRHSAAWVLLVEEEAEKLHETAADGVSLILKRDIHKDDFISGVLERSETEICNDVPGSRLLENASSQEIAVLCAPIKTDQSVLGVILLIQKAPEIFDARDLKLVNAVALQAGPAIEIARLYQIAIVQGRMERELQMAYEVQASLIPSEPPSIPKKEWEFASRWRPARELSGDYYDFIPHGEDNYGLLIADVADKGMPSALFMVNTRSAVRFAVEQSGSPAAAISSANRLVSREATDGLFVTLIYGQLNSQTGSFTFVNAGHNPALHFHANSGTLSTLTRTGIPLGISFEADYTQSVTIIEPGDVVILYTDGITEATNSTLEEFGLDRLRSVILENQQTAAENIAAAIETAVNDFSDYAPLVDDFTLMVVQRKPREREA